MTKISFILPVRNESSLIASQLMRLQDYRAAGHEVIVVDGGSDDGTAELAAPLADKVLHNAPGRSGQMNAGAAAASGDVLLFLHVDTQLPARADERVQRALASKDSEWGWFRVQLSHPGLVYRVIATCMNWRTRLTFVCTGDQAMFVTTGLFRQIGGFPELALMEDVAVCKLLRRKSTPNWIQAPAVTSARRWQQRGVVHTVLLMWWLRLLYFAGVSPDYLLRLYYPKAATQADSSHND